MRESITLILLHGAFWQPENRLAAKSPPRLRSGCVYLAALDERLR
jgi:hypothetical protein